MSKNKLNAFISSDNQVIDSWDEVSENEKMASAKWSQNRFRIIVLILTTLSLTMMLANIFAFNFTVLCMTEEKFRWENFNLNLGFDVFQNVDFTSPKGPDYGDFQSTKPPKTGSDLLPDVELPGFRMPRPDFNWQTFRLARHDPQLFMRIVKTIVVEIGERKARLLGEKFDPRNIDLNTFYRFRNGNIKIIQKINLGFNFSDINADAILRVKNYMQRKFNSTRNLYDVVDAEGRNVSQWKNLNLDDIELTNIDWNGVIRGRIRILERRADHYYNFNERALLIAIIAVGALVAIPFVCFSINRFGCRKTFIVVSIISAISTALCPLGASMGFYAFLAIRFLQGFGFASCLPVIGCVTSSWATLKENGLFNGALTSFIQLASIVSMPISGILCSTNLGWPFVYYVHAILTLILTIIWGLIYRDFPSDSNYVSIVELRKIQNDKVIDGRKRHNRQEFPFKQICKDLAVLAVWIAAIGNMYSIQMILLFAPTYLNKVLNYKLLTVGFAAASPAFIQFFVKMLAGSYSDKIKSINETLKIRIFNSIAFGGMATCLILLAILPDEVPPLLAVVLLTGAAAFLGFNVGGFFKSATLIGRQHAYFINVVVQIIMCIAMLTVPFIVYRMTPDNTPSQWGNVFIFHGILLLGTNAVFWYLGSANAAEFTKTDSSLTKAQNDLKKEQAKPIISSPILKNPPQSKKSPTNA